MIVLPQPSCHNRLKSLNSFSVGLLDRLPFHIAREAELNIERAIVLGAAIFCLWAGVLPNTASAQEHRSPVVAREFQQEHPCPSTGQTSGACPGYIKDHINM